MSIPKEVAANLRWRTDLLRQAENDPKFQLELLTMASKSILFWINAFVWTNRLFIILPDGSRRQCVAHEAHVPFVTWAIQDTHILEVERAIDKGYDLLTDKSRDMGATWNHVAVVYHKWLFEKDRSFLLLSRKEDCVDSSGKKGMGNPADPGTLFGKIDYISMWLPRWMMPAHTRTTMHLVNLHTRSRLDGESANKTAGSSDRRTAILLDEMAKMDEGEAIKRSTRDVTASRLANSTPNGPATAFSKWRMDGTIKVFILPWWEHPEKGIGRYIEMDEITGKEKVLSPWYIRERQARSPRELAIEVDMDHIGSGETFFEIEVIAKHKKLFASLPPISTGMHLSFKQDVAVAKMPEYIQKLRLDMLVVRPGTRGPWTFFEHLIDGRPDQTLDYVFGIDIGKGMGASNSIISAGCVQTQRKVAEWASASFAPHDFAIIVAASAIWFGGSQRGHRPFVIWESNGDPGIYFGKMFVRTLKYPSYYWDRHAVGQLKTPKAKKYGWHSNPEKKAEMLGDYRRALDHGTFINPSMIALNEAETYVYYSGGGQIGPAALQEESEAARKTHGDRVIGDGLCHKGISESHVITNKPLEPPENSIGGRYKKFRKQRDVTRANTTWDFRGFGG